MTTTTHPIEVTDANFEKTVLKADTPAIVDFWAPWCGPCRMMAPVFEELAGQYAGRMLFGKLNVDDNMNVPTQYSTFSIPTLILFKGGQEVGRVVGYNSKERLASVIESVL